MNAEITINFRDLAMFVFRREGITVIFPSINHQTRITRTASWEDVLVELPQGFSLSILEDGRPMAPAPSAGPSGVYATELSWASRQPVTIAPDTLAGPVPVDINGRMQLSGGYLLDSPSEVKNGCWANEEWDFGHGGRHRVTECMKFAFTAKPRSTYELAGAGQPIGLTPGQSLFVWNGDRRADKISDGAVTELPEFAEFARLAAVNAVTPRRTSPIPIAETYEDRPCPATFCFLF